MVLRNSSICVISVIFLAVASCSQYDQLAIKATPATGYAPCGVHLEAVLQGHNGNGTSFVWDFGDGSAPAEGREADHVYTRAGVYTATLTVTQGQGKGEKQQASATQVITVTSRAPEAALDAYACDEDSTLEIPAASGVLANDRAPDGGAMAAELASAPAHGTVTLAADGSFVYRPAANFFGDDSFTYRARIGEAQSDPVLVLITVNPVNVPPMISTWSPEGETVFLPVGSSQEFAVEAWDADGEALAYEWKKDGHPMEMDGEAGPAFTYAPTNADGGTRTIEVAVTDPRGGTASHSWQVTGLLDYVVPISPIGSVDTLTPTFSWHAVPGATSYELWIIDAKGVRVQAMTSTAPSIRTLTPLNPGEPYIWKARSISATGKGEFSVAMTFSVCSRYAAPKLLAPLGAVNSLQPTFSWTPVGGATDYDIWISDNSGANVYRFSATGTTVRVPKVLPADNPCTWQVRAKSGDEYGVWSELMSFVPSAALDTPVPIGPIGTTAELTPAFNWSTVAGASG